MRVQEIYSRLGLERPDRFMIQSIHKQADDRIIPISQIGFPVRQVGNTTYMLAKAIERATESKEDITIVSYNTVARMFLREQYIRMLEKLNIPFLVEPGLVVMTSIINNKNEKPVLVNFAVSNKNHFFDPAINDY